MNRDVSGRRMLVVGAARSGIAASALLCKRGAKVTLYDQKSQAELAEALGALAGFDLSLALGVDPLGLLGDCDALVISPGVPVDSPLVLEAKARGIEVLGEIEVGFTLAQGRVVAITGTNGKTTTTTLVGEIYKNAGRVAYVAGNIGTPYCTFADMAQADDVIVLEVSSFQLETVSTFAPTVSAVLNITEDHLNRHGDMATYIQMKERVFEKQQPGDFTVLNYDDAVTRSMAERTPATVVFFSSTQALEYGAWVQDGTIVFSSKEGTRPICPVDQVAIPGKHNLENALAASAIAMVSGVPAPVIRHTLRSFQGVEHRIEFVREVDGVRYINDSKGTNVDAAIKAIEAMAVPTVLIAGGYDKHTDFAPFAGAISRGSISHVVLMGQTRFQLQAALAAAGYTAITTVETLAEAITAARNCAVRSGNVLLSPACASFDQFKDYEERGAVFKSLVLALEEVQP